MRDDLLRAVDVEGYQLRMWATTRTDWRGQTRIRYEFKTPAGDVLFAGADFCGSPMRADDADETLRSLLGFLTLRPGDTDREYFDEYTPEQLAFANGPAEALQLWAMDEIEDAPAFVELPDSPYQAED
jgi:hypothetical protein